MEPALRGVLCEPKQRPKNPAGDVHSILPDPRRKAGGTPEKGQRHPCLPDAEPTLAKAREFAPGRSHGMRRLCCIFSNEICFKKGPFVYFLKQTKGRGGTLGLTEALGSLERPPRKARGLRIRRAPPGAGRPRRQEHIELPARFRVAAKI